MTKPKECCIGITSTYCFLEIQHRSTKSCYKMIIYLEKTESYVREKKTE